MHFVGSTQANPYACTVAAIATLWGPLHGDAASTRAAIRAPRCCANPATRCSTSWGQRDDPLLELAMELERVVLADDYFIERKLYPNVDFYSGIIFRALGLPPAMFTPVFAVARTVGWVAHWNEMIADPETRLFRPRQLYTGSGERPLVPVPERTTHRPLVG